MRGMTAEQERIALLQAELAMAEAAQRGLAAERDALLQSTSWLATRPLRLLGAALPVPLRRATSHLSRSISRLANLVLTKKIARPRRAPADKEAAGGPSQNIISSVPTPPSEDESSIEDAVPAAPTRAQVLLAPVPRGGRIIEIGPSFSPIAPKSEGWNTVSIDHLTKDGLVAKYNGEPFVDVARIEPVDFLWVSGPLSNAVPKTLHGSFDALVASHVIEHTPDLIDFLDSATTLVKYDGVVVLAIPDKRYC